MQQPFTVLIFLHAGQSHHGLHVLQANKSHRACVGIHACSMSDNHSYHVLVVVHVHCQSILHRALLSLKIARRSSACFSLLVQDSAALALQVSVLLLGPRGSGRATAVRAATAALGIHLVPFSCHDLKGQTDSQTATALKASLEAAQGFAPVVLLLRHFEVLSESPQGASQGDCQSQCQKL